jgi:hypothetical protein
METVHALAGIDLEAWYSHRCAPERGRQGRRLELVRESSLEEYARHFWSRQERKEAARDREPLDDIALGGDPVWWLGKTYPSKVPRSENDLVRVVRLNREEVEAIRLPGYALDDRWMELHGLVPVPRSTRMADLAARALEQGFFQETRPRLRSSQHSYYDEWKRAGYLREALDGRDLPLIQRVRPGEYEIVDGWGRFLPFAALMLEGLPFAAVITFAADRSW